LLRTRSLVPVCLLQTMSAAHSHASRVPRLDSPHRIGYELWPRPGTNSSMGQFSLPARRLMLIHLPRLSGVVLLLGACVFFLDGLSGQEPDGPQVASPLPTGPANPQAPASAPEEPAVPKGIEVMTRGPVHEAFAAPAVDPKPSPLVAKKPPEAIDEMPPEHRPEGEVVWIKGYWAYDDDRNDYLWVSGCWRSKPPGKEWVAGYWREQSGQHQWVSGFWQNAAAPPPQGNTAPNANANAVTYYPEPPAPPNVAPPGEAPDANSFYVPGYYVWQGDHYAWRAGYWGRIRTGYVWVPSHYRWPPSGYVFIAGYWDVVVSRRGMLYAPVTVDVAVVGPRFVYTPAYAVCDTVVLDAMFVRPAYCHYYFGDCY